METQAMKKHGKCKQSRVQLSTVDIIAVGFLFLISFMFSSSHLLSSVIVSHYIRSYSSVVSKTANNEATLTLGLQETIRLKIRNLLLITLERRYMWTLCNSDLQWILMWLSSTCPQSPQEAMDQWASISDYSEYEAKYKTMKSQMSLLRQ